VLTPEAEAIPTPRARLWYLAAFVVGIALLGAMVQRVGLADVRRGLASVGPWFVLIVALGGARFAARAQSWMACAEAGGERLRFRDAFAAVLSADALGNLTPLGLLASEPAKVLLVRRRLSTVSGVSSVVADNAFYTLSVILVIALGTVLFLRRASVPDPLRFAAEVVLAAAFVFLVSVTWAARRQPAVLSHVARLAATLGQRVHLSTDRLAEIERRFYGVLSWPVARLLRIAGWQIAFHAAALLEVYLVLRLLPGAGHVTVLDAFKFIPYRLGVDEAGSALVARALGFDPTVGVTLALVRKLRILAWNAVGVGLLARDRA
jgi:glycosyltransferase 2 family protein